jgi:hypothetical protein
MSIHDFLFHLNEITNKWETAPRDSYNELFSGGDNVIRSSKIETLISLIKKYDGDINKIKKNVK